MKYLVIIPARGGSKGIPRKNIKLLNNKPLIKYTLDAAREVFKDEFICVSTDDIEIKEVVESFGINLPFLRPAELSGDKATSREAILHALDFYQNEKKMSFDTVLLLQPTSPFRNAHHIKDAINLWEKNLDMVVSVQESKTNPYYNLFEENKNGFLHKSKEGNFTRRQDIPKTWEFNGAIYIIDAKTLRKKEIHEFKKIRKYVMDEISSIDIDSKKDWSLAETILKGR